MAESGQSLEAPVSTTMTPMDTVTTPQPEKKGSLFSSFKNLPVIKNFLGGSKTETVNIASEVQSTNVFSSETSALPESAPLTAVGSEASVGTPGSIDAVAQSVQNDLANQMEAKPTPAMTMPSVESQTPQPEPAPPIVSDEATKDLVAGMATRANGLPGTVLQNPEPVSNSAGDEPVAA